MYIFPEVLLKEPSTNYDLIFLPLNYLLGQKTEEWETWLYFSPFTGDHGIEI